MTGKKRALAVGSIATICAAAGLFAGHAWAGGIPATGVLSYSGVIEDASGNPVTDDHQVQVNLWATPTGGVTPLCQGGPQTASARFSIPLDDGCAAVVKDNPDLYAELLIDGVGLGRTKLGAVPYAVEAAHAVSADKADLLGTLTPASVQQRVSGTCAAGSSVRTVAADGTVTCETDDNTTYSGSSGVTLTGTNFTADTAFLQRRVINTCNLGQSIRTIAADGTVTCEVDGPYSNAPICRTAPCANPAAGASASCTCNADEAMQGITYGDESGDGSDANFMVSIRCCK